MSSPLPKGIPSEESGNPFYFMVYRFPSFAEGTPLEHRNDKLAKITFESTSNLNFLKTFLTFHNYPANLSVLLFLSPQPQKVRYL